MFGQSPISCWPGSSDGGQLSGAFRSTVVKTCSRHSATGVVCNSRNLQAITIVMCTICDYTCACTHIFLERLSSNFSGVVPFRLTPCGFVLLVKYVHIHCIFMWRSWSLCSVKCKISHRTVWWYIMTYFSSKTVNKSRIALFRPLCRKHSGFGRCLVAWAAGCIK